MMLLVNPMRFGVQASVEPLERNCTPEDMLHTCDQGSANLWSDSLVNSCTSINQIAAGRLSEDGTTKNLAPAPSGGLKVETFMEERMDLTNSTPPIHQGGKHISSQKCEYQLIQIPFILWIRKEQLINKWKQMSHCWHNSSYLAAMQASHSLMYGFRKPIWRLKARCGAFWHRMWMGILSSHVNGLKQRA